MQPVAKAQTDDKQADQPVFKVQILASSTKLPSSSPRFKKRDDVDRYEEGGMYKYTIGASTNYNEINRMRGTLAENFPGAFVVAFRNGEKMNITEAIRMFKNKRR